MKRYAQVFGTVLALRMSTGSACNIRSDSYRGESTAQGLQWFAAPGKARQEEDRGGNGGKVVLSMHTKEHHLNFPVLNA